jgi:hypothetical protein
MQCNKYSVMTQETLVDRQSGGGGADLHYSNVHLFHSHTYELLPYAYVLNLPLSQQ